MHSSLTFLFLCALAVSAAFGQSLSIKKVDSQYSIEASAPADRPGTLQATEDFRLWVDVTNNVSDPVSSLLKYSHVSSRFFRLVPAAPEPSPVRIVAIGDSLISDAMGWGGGIYGYLNKNATFINYAWPGYDSRGAVQWHLAALQLVKPDYVFFELGATDMAHEITEEQFEENLRTIITTIRGWNGVPIAVTYHCHRRFDAAGNLAVWDLPYNPIVRKVATEMNIPLVDLHKILGELYQKLGPSGSEFMKYISPDFPNDTIHFSPLGGVWVSQMALKTLPNLGPYLSEKIFDPPPNP
jgi:lysophospholipase L1-like esterase